MMPFCRSSVAEGADATFPDAPGRVTPVLPEKSVDADIKGIFNEFFGKEVERALASPEVVDDAQLARRLFEEARKRSDHAAFAGYVLDHVVYLGSACPDARALVYSSLTVQLRNSLRPSDGCLKRMVQLAPKVVEAMGRESRPGWILQTWGPDAEEYCRKRLKAGEFDQALGAAATLGKACRKHIGSVPYQVDSLIQAVEFVCNLNLTREHCTTVVAQKGEHAQEQLFLAVYALFINGGPAEAIPHLRASGVKAAERLAQKLAQPPCRDTGQTLLDIALTMTNLAKEISGPFPRYLLSRQVCEALKAALDLGDLSDAGRLRAELLLEQAGKDFAKIADDLPRLVKETVIPDPAARPDGARGGDWAFFAHVSNASEGSDFFRVQSPGAKRIVYVIDRSGSMTDTIMHVKHELASSIGALKSNQRFHVIFHSTGPAVPMPGGGLVPATRANKEAARRFINSIVPVGQTDPSMALRMAFAAKPDVIYLLSDGEFEKGIVNLIDTLNDSKEVTVHGVCFVYSGGEAILQQIAARNGGKYAYVGEDDLKSFGKGQLPESVQTPTPSATTTQDTTGDSEKIEAAVGDVMPKNDRERLEKMIGVLEKRRVCIGCKGKGTTTQRRRVPVSPSSTETRLVITTKPCSSCGGTGRTPAFGVRHIIIEVNKILKKHGSAVPDDLRKQAETAKSYYK